MMRLKIGFILILVTAFGLWSFVSANLAPVSSDKSTKSVIIAKGQGVNEIAEKLKDENLIRSAFFFRVYLKKEGLDDQIKAGTFKLSPSQSTAEIAKALTNSPEDVWVTLIEGWRVEEMAEELNKRLGVKKEDFTKQAKEGYMFPDTYLFPREITTAGIVKVLRDTFDTRFTDDLKSKIKSQGLSEKEGVILASIVEREARSDGARQMVASILLKRLKIGMGLNADATIQYILGYQSAEKSWWKRHLTKDDLQTASPYNTYLHFGLPPTPICNTSLSSLTAVANASSSVPYLYYYHDSKGVSHYGKTLEEHNENVAKYP